MLVFVVIALATLLASLTDWLFMDILIHRYYAAAPAMWQTRGGTARIVVSQMIGTMASVVVIVLCLVGTAPPLTVAVGVWLAGPLPITLQNMQWMGLHPAIGASHAAGWLARLLLASGVVVALLGH